MNIQIRRCAGLVLTIALFSTIAVLQAGSLTPPAGPIVPTMKTLSEIEPRTAINLTNTPGDANSIYKITQSGSYYLTGNLQGVAGKIGIEVVASNVTIDLCGFEMVGVAGSLAGFDLNNGGAGGLLGIKIHNGTIRGWGSDGIKGNLSGGHYLLNLTIATITGYGITVNTNTTIENCIIYGCTLDGIATSNNVVIINTISGGNGASGIAAGTSSTVTHCAGYINVGAGIVIVGGKGTISNCNATLNSGTGISAGDGGNISHCHADNNGTGISVGEGGVIAHCAANDNNADGIFAGSTSTVTACSAWSNTANGINVTASTVSGCTARENGGDGITTVNGCNIQACTVASNGDDGIVAGFGSVVSNCTSRENTGDGIQCTSDCRIADNTCDGNGLGAASAAGIHLTSSDCRVEGNNVTDNDRGIDVDVSGNVIIRNTASGNTTNYEIVANNKVGTIVLAPDSLAISGDSGGAGVGTTNPWANLSF